MNESVASSAATLSSWTFWRGRLARASIIGGLAMMAAQLLPALPQEQRVEILAPSGVTITDLTLVYLDARDGTSLAGAEIHPATDTSSVAHSVSLSDGAYVLSISAQLKTLGAQAVPSSIEQKQPVTLSGGSLRVQLQLPPAEHGH